MLSPSSIASISRLKGNARLEKFLGSGVKLMVDAFQPRRFHLGVDLRRLNACVSEQLLNLTEVSAAGE